MGQLLIKATDAASLHLAHIGRQASPSTGIDHRKIDPGELVDRYGMWVHRCISINASTAASVPAKVFTTAVNAGVQSKAGEAVFRRPSKRDRAYLAGRLAVQPGARAIKAIQRTRLEDLRELPADNPISDLLADINPWSDGYAYRESLYADLQIFGRAYTHVVTDTSSRAIPSELWRIMPQKTKVLRSTSDYVDGFEVGSGDVKVTYTPDEVLWFRLYDPWDEWEGTGPLEAWLKTVDAAFAIQSFQDWLFKRGGTPDYIVKSKAKLGDDGKRAFRKEWRRLFGKLFNRQENVGFLEGDAELHKLGQTNRELEFGQSEDRKRDQIGQAFGVPKALLTSDDVNRANLDGSRQLHIETTIWPMVQRVEDTLNEQLVQRYGGQYVLIHDNPIGEDQEQRIAVRDSQLRSGYSLNETRTMDGEETLDDPLADEPMISAALMPLSSLAAGVSGTDAEGETMEGAEPAPAVETATVLAGGQIQAATAIVQLVIDDKLPLESARGQLIVLLNLTDEQAGLMLAGVEGFEKPTPVMPPGLAPGPDEPDEDEQEERSFSPEQVAGLLKAILTPPSDNGQAKVEPPKMLPERLSQKEMLLSVKDAVGDIENPEGDERFSRPMADDVDDVLKRQLKRVLALLGAALPIRLTGPTGPENYMPDDDVAAWQDELRAASVPHIRTAIKETAERAVQRVNTTISFDLENTRVRDYLSNTSRRIGREVTDTWRKTIREKLVQGIDAGESPKQIAKRLSEVTGFAKPYAERITRTEMAFSAIKGTELGWQQSGVVFGKQFVLAPDACEWCQAVADELGDGRGELADSKTIPVDQSMLQFGHVLKAEFTQADGTTVEREMTLDYAPDDENLVVPPVHPHCRCSIRPVLEGE